MQNFGEETICHLLPTYLQNLKDISTQFYYVKLSAVKDSKAIFNCPSRENSYVPDSAYLLKEIWNFSKYTWKKNIFFLKMKVGLHYVNLQGTVHI